MSTAILDVQCVLAADSSYLIKEMSVVDVDGGSCQHWIFKTPHKMQNPKSRSVNKWLCRNYHRLSLDSGDVEYAEIEGILKSLDFTCVYVKGEQKQKIIENYIPDVEVIDMQELGCPPLYQLRDGCNTKSPSSSQSTRCLYHKNFDFKHCTFYNVLNLKKWFVNNT